MLHVTQQNQAHMTPFLSGPSTRAMRINDRQALQRRIYTRGAESASAGGS